MNGGHSRLIVSRCGDEFWIIPAIVNGRPVSSDVALREAMRTGGPLGRYATLRQAADAKAALLADPDDGPVAA